jgi:hypothetical protein
MSKQNKITTDPETWKIRFEVGYLNYTGTATKMKNDKGIFYRVNYAWDNSPNYMYTGNLFPVEKEMTIPKLIEWTCDTTDIEAKFISPVGSAIEKSLKESNYPLF